MAATNFSLTFNDSLTANVSDETVLDPKLIVSDYTTEKNSCLMNNEMGHMYLIDFHNFFNNDDTLATYITQIATKLDKNYIKEDGETSETSLGALMLDKYNSDNNLTGIDKMENINWTVNLSEFYRAIKESSVTDDEFVATPGDASEKNHLQIIFKFNCNDKIYKVGFEWIMMNT